MVTGERDDREQIICRNIKTPVQFRPPGRMRKSVDAALQFVRKLSGTTKPFETQ
ncbi:DUF2277 family protein (plasmid) [Sinorhizobium meliloti]|nr:DUF2277 family protein [Sinorhizobium meliloti]